MRHFPLALAAFMLGGCAVYLTWSPTNRPPHVMTPRAPESVELHTVQPPSRDFVDVGVIEAISSQPASWDALTKGLRDGAGRLGCDSLVVEGPQTIAGAFRQRGTCIVYR